MPSALSQSSVFAENGLPSVTAFPSSWKTPLGSSTPPPMSAATVAADSKSDPQTIDRSRFALKHRKRAKNLVPMMVFLLVVCAHVYLGRGPGLQNNRWSERVEWQHRARGSSEDKPLARANCRFACPGWGS